MDLLKFTLGGKTAFFKKPEVNKFYYFTFGCIHKVALMGIFGAILGLGGYAQMDEKTDEFPEFYEKLKQVKVAIVPNAREAYIPKKIQIFNNTVGYASKEVGGILNVKEQWLENPSWDIYVVLQDSITNQLAKMIMNHEAVYIPYLGSNDHLADISNATILKGVEPTKEYDRIHSVFIKELVTLRAGSFFFEEDDSYIYRYEEMLPVELDETLQLYVMKNFEATNALIEKYEDPVYQIEDQFITFF